MRNAAPWLVGAVLFVHVSAPEKALAAAPPAELMSRLATQAQGFEQMKKRASYAIVGKLEELTSDRTVSATKTMRAKAVANGTEVRWEILEYKEDGLDKTADARKRARERAAEDPKKKGKRDFHMPFLPSEQLRYSFDQVEVDPTEPTRVKITFVPKVKAEDTIEGSAWVDAKAGTLISAGFKLSKTPTFVDYVHVTVEFGAPTPLGPAVSKIHVDGKGGILFWSKVFRVDAVVSEYAIAP